MELYDKGLILTEQLLEFDLCDEESSGSDAQSDEDLSERSESDQQ